MAGREADGRMSIVDLKGWKRVTSDALIAGPCKWDPSSRYILADRKTNAPFWCQQTEFIILDAVTREVASIPAIIPDDWAHRHDWVMIPQSPEPPGGSAKQPR